MGGGSTAHDDRLQTRCPKWHLEAAPVLDEPGLVDDRGPPLHKVCDLVPVGSIHPLGGQEEGGQARLRPFVLELRSSQDAAVAGDDDPVTLSSESTDPIFVFGVAGELVLKMANYMAIFL